MGQEIGWLKVVRIKMMTSERRVCLGLAADLKRYGVPCFGAETRKVRAPNERLCRRTESN